MRRAGPLVVLLCFVMSLPAVGQQQGQEASDSDNAPTVVRGTVVDAETNDPVESATVALWTSRGDSSLVTGTITQEDGSFRLEHGEAGEYYVRISFVGYQTKRMTDVTVGQGNQEVDLGEITLAESTAEMEAVEISAEREYMQVEADKTVYSPQNQPVTAGGSARNVLEEIPSVDVSMEGDISLRGSQNVAIYLNGKPAPMSGQALTSFLEGLSAGDIERVEVIPNPSVRYKPEGTSGIINIVLAEDEDRGWGGSVSASASTDSDYDGSGNVNYGNGPWNIFSNYSLRYDEDQDSGSRFRINRMADPLNYLSQESSEEEQDLDHTFNTTVDYQVNDLSNVSFRTMLSRRGSEEEELMSYARRGPDSSMTDRYERNSLSNRSDFGMDYRFDFERIVEPNQNELTAQVDYERDWESNDDRYLQQNLTLNGGDVIDQRPEEEQRVDENEVEQEASAEIDYIRPLWSDTKLEAGYEADFEHLDSEYYSESRRENGNFTPDTDLNNRFNYIEWMHSVYGILNGSVGDFSAQVGGRLERAKTTFDQETLGETFENSYFSFFPSVHLSYEATQSNTINVSYSKRVRRPSSWQMNPYSDYEDPTFRRVGNPYLTPEYTHSFEAGYKRLGERYTISLSPYFRHTVDEISWHEEITEDGVSILTFENFATENSYGIELVSSLTLGDWLKANGSFNAFKRVTDATNVQSTLSNNALGYQARLRFTATIVEGLNFQFSQYYRSGHDIPGGHIGASTRSNIALQQDLMGEKASLSLRASDLLGEDAFHIQRDTERFYQESTRHRDPRSVELNFRYNFGQQNNDRRRDRGGGEGGGEEGGYGGDM